MLLSLSCRELARVLCGRTCVLQQFASVPGSVFVLKVTQTTTAGELHSLIGQTPTRECTPESETSTRNVCCGNRAQLSRPHSAGQMVIFHSHCFFFLLLLISQCWYKSLKVTYKYHSHSKSNLKNSTFCPTAFAEA